MKVRKRIDFTPLVFTVIAVIVLSQYSFPLLESIFYDIRVKTCIDTNKKDNVVIITMDEESDEFLGEKYPYTYASHSRLLKRLLYDSPLIVNYFVNFSETERERENKNFQHFSTQIEEFIETGGAFRFGTDLDVWGEQLPPSGLKKFGYSLGVINSDGTTFAKDDVARRALLNVSGEDTIHLWTANKYREFQGKKSLNIGSVLGAYYLREADATYALFKYPISPLERDDKISKIPFHRVVVGNFPKGYFTDKIILIGSSYISRPSEDYVLTPFNREKLSSSKLSVHASIILSLINEKTVLELPIMVSNILSVIIAIFLSIIIFKVRPTRGLLITIILMILIMLISYLLFTLMGIWIYMTHLILSVIIVYYIWVPFKAIGEYQRRFAIQEESKLIKQVESLKRNFISLMSHDLKTPVAKIAGIADITLQQNRENTALCKNLQTIIDSTKELNRFITSILDLTKIESQKLNLNRVSKDINPLIELVIASLKFEADSKNIIVESNLSPLFPIEIDINLMNRVFSNLVENAIKYSGENTIVSVKSWDDSDWVYVEIKDNGVGIPSKDLEHIFDKFYRVKNDASHSIKGTGLGLYLVKYFVELHGGTISANSTLGEGTIFQIKLKNS